MPQPTPIEVFYSYSHKDEELRDQLQPHLAMLKREGIIKEWHDRGIPAGEEWADEIDEHLNSADIILLLVSADFLASNYCYAIELRRAMERHEAGEAVVIPVILRPCSWTTAPFGKLQALPKDSKPVTRWPDRDEAFLNVEQGIRGVVKKLLSDRAARQAQANEGDAEVIPLPPNIPRPPVVGFVARRDAQGRDIIERLRAELAPERGRLVALWGPGGAGKSTLAAEAVRALIELFPGGVVWASALDRADFTSATLLDEVATQLGRSDLRTLAPAEKEMQVAALLAARPALVVLDNFETIAEGERGRCVKFLAERAACPALVTTRSPVEEALDIPLDAMTLEEAREFLRRLVGETRKPENFDRLDRDDLIRRCEANPLVLQWVVKQIDLALPPQTVLGYLAQGEGDAARRVFTRSFELPQVGEDGRAALLALSLFVPSASRPALAEVSGFGDDLRRLDKAVEGLSALWLVEATEGNERLFLRGLTSELAKSHLSKDSRADEFHRRFVAHFLRHAEAHRQPTPEDYDALEAEKDNLLGATDSAYSLEDWPSMWTIAYALAVPTVGMLYVRGYWDEALRRNKQALEAARFVRNERLIALSTQGLATISHSRGDLDEARRLYGESLEIAKRLDDQRHIALITWGLGNISKDQGNTKEAKKLFQESLKTFRQSKDEKNTAGVLHQLAMLAQAQGDSAEAQRLYGESLEIAKRLNNQTNIASTLHQLAILAQDQGDMEEARRLYGESLKIKKRLGNQDGIAISLWALGLLTEREGNKLEAARLIREALSIFEKLGSPNAEIARENLARVEGEAG